MLALPQSCCGFPYAPTLVPFVHFVATSFLEMTCHVSMHHHRQSEF